MLARPSASTKNTIPPADALVLYAELPEAQVRAVQRRIQAGELAVVHRGIASARPEEEWPLLIARERIRVLAALFPDAVFTCCSAFQGGIPVDGVIYLGSSYRRSVALPGLQVEIIKAPGRLAGDAPMQGRPLYFPSEARVLLENLSRRRGYAPYVVSEEEVEKRLLGICASRGEQALSQLRETARALASELGQEAALARLDGMVGSILKTRSSTLNTPAGKAFTAQPLYDHARLQLFEKLASVLRSVPLPHVPAVAGSGRARLHFAFLESYFSNFIEGTEFEVQDAKAFVLDGHPILARPKDSHDIIGVYRQAENPGWAAQTLASGEGVLAQLQARHRDQMAERPEVNPGDFKARANRAGNTEFVFPELVRGTLIEASMILPSVPPGLARALLAMFMVAEVHPFSDGNGRLARLVMNAELTVVGATRIIIPTLYREQYLDCLRVLSREGEPQAFIDAMQQAQAWTAAFDYDDIDAVIEQMARCNAFERSLVQHRLLMPAPAPAPLT